MHWLKWKLRGGKMYVQRCALVGGRGSWASSVAELINYTVSQKKFPFLNFL